MSDPFVQRLSGAIPKPRKFNTRHKLMRKLATWKAKYLEALTNSVNHDLDKWDKTNKEEADNYFRGQYEQRVAEVERQMLESFEAAKETLEANYQERCLKLEEAYQQATQNMPSSNLEAELQEALANSQNLLRAAELRVLALMSSNSDKLTQIQELGLELSNSKALIKYMKADTDNNEQG